MPFEEALRENRVPPQVGDIRLRSEPGRLIGETRPRTGVAALAPSLLRAGALGLGLLAVAGLVGPGAASLAPVLVPALLAALALVAAQRLDVGLGRRRFVLHFAAELLRLETLPRGGGHPVSFQIPFDAVTAVDLVEEQPGGLGIRLSWEQPEGMEHRQLLVRHARASEGEALHRVWRALRNAFGLPQTPLPGDP